MITTVKRFLEKHDLANSNKTILVGFSGGFDSCAMLDALAKLQNEFNFKLCAAHLNHGWRAEADTEEKACQEFCKQRNIEFYSEKLNPTTPKTETAAREARYKFFERAAKYFDTKIILTAHTKSDNVETILYRIARGTGISGLCAINETRRLNNIEIFRPILSLTRQDIEKYCAQNNLTPNNDTSNFDTKYKRNFIRHEILPKLKEINPIAEHAIESLRENSCDEEAIVNEYLTQIKKNIYSGEKINTDKFLNLSHPVKQRIVYDFIQTVGLEYDKKKVLNILEFIQTASEFKTGKTLSLAENLWLFCSAKEFYLIKKVAPQKNENPLKIQPCNAQYKFANIIFTIKEFNCANFVYPKETENFALVDLSGQKELELRYRQNGDIIQPFGMPATTKLKKYFINKNIPKHKKDSIVLLCNQTEVLWVPKVGLSEKLRVKSRPTHIIKIEEV